MKTGAKWMRKLHRWLSIPMLLLIPISMVLRVSGNGDVMKDIPKWETTQSILILFLAVSGGYLYVFRLVSKRRRERRSVRATAAAEAPAVA